MRETHPDPVVHAREVKSLEELEWALLTIRKCQDVVHRNLHLDQTLEHTNLYLLTGILWLKEAIRAQALLIERRFDGQPKKTASPEGPAKTVEGAEGKKGWDA